MTPRVLALDVGERRIGVAVSDPLGLTAQGVETIVSQGWTHDVQRVGELLALYETDRLLVGLPRSLSGQVSSICSSLQLYYTGGSKAEDEDSNQNNQ